MALLSSNLLLIWSSSGALCKSYSISLMGEFRNPLPATALATLAGSSPYRIDHSASCVSLMMKPSRLAPWPPADCSPSSSARSSSSPWFMTTGVSCQDAFFGCLRKSRPSFWRYFWWRWCVWSGTATGLVGAAASFQRDLMLPGLLAGSVFSLSGGTDSFYTTNGLFI